MLRMRGSYDYDGVTQTDNDGAERCVGLQTVSQYKRSNTTNRHTSDGRRQNRNLLGKCNEESGLQDLGITRRCIICGDNGNEFSILQSTTDRHGNVYGEHRRNADTWRAEKISRQFVGKLCSPCGFSGNEIPVSRKAVMSWT